VSVQKFTTESAEVAEERFFTARCAQDAKSAKKGKTAKERVLALAGQGMRKD
jgi:hypothetical protein